MTKHPMMGACVSGVSEWGRVSVVCQSGGVYLLNVKWYAVSCLQTGCILGVGTSSFNLGQGEGGGGEGVGRGWGGGGDGTYVQSHLSACRVAIIPTLSRTLPHLHVDTDVQYDTP